MKLCIHLMCIPMLLAKRNEFQCLSRAARERLALYCFAMLEAGCSPKRSGGKGKWQGVSQRRLEKYIRRASIRPAREALVQLGVIEVDGKFSFRVPDAKRPLGHRFTEAVLEGEFIEFELKSTPAVKRFRKQKDWQNRNCEPSIRVKGNATETHLSLFHLMYQLELSNDSIRQVVESLPPEKRPNVHLAGTEFLQKRFFATIDDTGRLYTSLANLKKELRWLLTIQGEPLCEVDVRACQPLLLSVIVEPHVSTSECMAFRRLAETREIYDQFRDVTGLSMNEAKEAGLAFLCGPSPSKRAIARVSEAVKTGDHIGLQPKDPIHLWFTQSFPEITKFLITSKSSARSSLKMNTWQRRAARKKTAAYGVTSFEMQSLEASLIVDGVCKEFIQRFPGRFIGPIHDAVLCPKDLTEGVVEIMNGAFQRRGLHPSIKIEVGGRVLREIHPCRNTIKHDVF